MGPIAMKLTPTKTLKPCGTMKGSSSLGLEAVPSTPTLRQRLDAAAASEATSVRCQAFSPSSNVLLKQHAEMTPVAIGAQHYIPMDMDVSPTDNRKTQKEGVSRTHKGCDGDLRPIWSI